jgi:transcriptional regulator with XRE-family HTH domain
MSFLCYTESMNYTAYMPEVDMHKLKELRRLRVLTLQELEEKSGVSYSTLSRLEHGKTAAHPRTIRRLAKALDVEPSDLLKK